MQRYWTASYFLPLLADVMLVFTLLIPRSQFGQVILIGSYHVAVTYDELNQRPATTPAKKPVTTTAPVQTYDQIVESYKASGYRFQFLDCSGSPGSITLKQGLELMMDNRDAVSHAFVIGSRRFTLGQKTVLKF